ncbi:MAG: HisA/HisF-related TIM barrel protein, partial [Gemmatimonadales bacterium]
TSRLGRPQGGVSGPALLPIGLAAVRRVRERLPDIPIIGVGGIRSADDVRSYLRAGASLVAIGTAQLADPRLPLRIIRTLEQGDG